MEFRPVNIPNSLLSEGENYSFLIVGEVDLERGDSFFVMRDPFGYKMLMPAGFYEDYGFREGQEVVCKVDKISCSGKMYLEPRHPYYETGKLYEFEVVSIGFRQNLAGMDERYFRVRDCLGKEWLVRTDRSGGFPERIVCLVIRIRKGRLYLRLPDFNGEESWLEQGMTFPFTIVDQIKNPEAGMSSFILEDEKGVRHLLRKKHFHHYRLQVGQQIFCRVDDTFDDGYLLLEPEHPAYEIGKDYLFPVDHLDEYIYYNGHTQKMVVLRDVFGEEIRIHLNEAEAERWKVFEKLQCKVTGIRKSRVELEILGGV